jgi:ABC-type amino acid transport substrate-binding protein
VEDLAGATVGVQQGTTGQAYAEDETDAEDVRGFPEYADATTALRAGQVDAVIMDLPAAEDAVEANPGIEIVEELVTREEYGLSVAEDNTALLDAVNEALQEIKDDGTFAEIYVKWFDEEPAEEILTATHEPE